jgi:hypothetical protein
MNTNNGVLDFKSRGNATIPNRDARIFSTETGIDAGRIFHKKALI